MASWQAMRISWPPCLTGCLPEGGVLADVGAHVGRWALRLSRKASKVIAVEANPVTVAVLRANAELNDITNVDIRQVAAWDTHTRMRLEDPNQQTSGGSTRVLEDDDGTVQAAPLDEVFAGESRLDVIKLDVEGADLHALRGMAGTLKRLGPSLLIERHDIYGYYEFADLTGLLEELGYDWQHCDIYLPNGNRAPYLTAEPKGAA